MGLEIPVDGYIEAEEGERSTKTTQENVLMITILQETKLNEMKGWHAAMNQQRDRSLSGDHASVAWQPRLMAPQQIQ